MGAVHGSAGDVHRRPGSRGLIHPRMGSPLTSAPEVALLEPPGFLMLNYGPSTPVITVLAHIGYGAIVGGFTTLGA